MTNNQSYFAIDQMHTIATRVLNEQSFQPGDPTYILCLTVSCFAPIFVSDHLVMPEESQFSSQSLLNLCKSSFIFPIAPINFLGLIHCVLCIYQYIVSP